MDKYWELGGYYGNKGVCPAAHTCSGYPQPQITILARSKSFLTLLLTMVANRATSQSCQLPGEVALPLYSIKCLNIDIVANSQGFDHCRLAQVTDFPRVDFTNVKYTAINVHFIIITNSSSLASIIFCILLICLL